MTQQEKDVARIAELERERDEARAAADKYGLWANCGGVDTGKTCSRCNSHVYGVFFGSMDQPVCSCCDRDEMQQRIAKLEAALLAYRGRHGHFPDCLNRATRGLVCSSRCKQAAAALASTGDRDRGDR